MKEQVKTRVNIMYKSISIGEINKGVLQKQGINKDFAIHTLCAKCVFLVSSK